MALSPGHLPQPPTSHQAPPIPGHERRIKMVLTDVLGAYRKIAARNQHDDVMF